MTALLLAFLSSAALWWLYFDYVAQVAERRLELAEADRTSLARDGYTYLHVVLVAGVILAAVGDELVIAHPTDVLPAAEIAVVVAGPAVYLLGHALFRLRMAGTVSWKRLLGAAACVVLVRSGPSCRRSRSQPRSSQSRHRDRAPSASQEHGDGPVASRSPLERLPEPVANEKKGRRQPPSPAGSSENEPVSLDLRVRRTVAFRRGTTSWSSDLAIALTLSELTSHPNGVDRVRFTLPGSLECDVGARLDSIDGVTSTSGKRRCYRHRLRRIGPA